MCNGDKKAEEVRNRVKLTNKVSDQTKRDTRGKETLTNEVISYSEITK